VCVCARVKLAFVRIISAVIDRIIHQLQRYAGVAIRTRELRFTVALYSISVSGGGVNTRYKTVNT